MSTTMDELSAEVKQKTQTAINTIEFLKKFFKAGETGNEYQKVGQMMDDGTPSNFIFTGKNTDLSYFSQSETMPLSAIRNIGDENIKEAVKQTYDKAAQQGLIELDGDNIRITAKGKDYISQPDFVKAAKTDQEKAYQEAVDRMYQAQTGVNEVQMGAALSGHYVNDFTVFNHTDRIDLSDVINSPNKETAKQILSNVKKWQGCGAVTVKDGVAKITPAGKEMLKSAKFKASSIPVGERVVSKAGVPGKIIVVTKKAVSVAKAAVQTQAAMASKTR